MPDLIIVDGGKEQVKAVQKSLKDLKLKTVVIGLVKDKRHQTSKIISFNGKESDFENKSRIKNFLTGCQIEVHKYAINFHRYLHRKNSLKS